MEYIILDADYTESLERMVGRLLAKGWRCQGGVSVSHYVYAGSHRFRYAQAMTRETPPEADPSV